MTTRYVPMETFTHTAVAADATADYVEFTVPYAPKGMIAQIKAATTGVVNSAGLAVTYNSTSGKVKVAATAITAGDVISLIVF